MKFLKNGMKRKKGSVKIHQCDFSKHTFYNPADDEKSLEQPQPTSPVSPSPNYSLPPSFVDLIEWFDYFDREKNEFLDKEETVAAVMQTYASHEKLLNVSDIREHVYALWVTFDKNLDGMISKTDFLVPGGLGESLQTVMIDLQASTCSQSEHPTQQHSKTLCVTISDGPASGASYQPEQCPQQQCKTLCVTIPDGMAPGQLIKIATPSGSLITISIPGYSSWSCHPDGKKKFLYDIV